MLDLNCEARVKKISKLAYREAGARLARDEGAQIREKRGITLARFGYFAKFCRKAARAAWKPHMPWTPPPGGVELEQM